MLPPRRPPAPLCPPQCVDFEGFKLFLRSYLEAADVPDTLCHHLFRSFQSTGQPGAGEDLGGGTGKWGGGSGHGGERGFSLVHPTDADLVCVNDVSCYFSLLEGGRPEDKLECEWGSCGTGRPGGAPPSDSAVPLPPPAVTFKLYDKDGNGLLDSSVRGQGWGGHLGPRHHPPPSSSPCCAAGGGADHHPDDAGGPIPGLGRHRAEAGEWPRIPPHRVPPPDPLSPTSPPDPAGDDAGDRL